MNKISIAEEFRNSKKRRLTKTFVLYIDKDCDEEEKSAVCNYKCLHCYYSYAAKKMKTLAEMKQEIDYAISLGADHVQMTGGEPTMHKDFLELAKYIKSKEVMCSVITNASMLANFDFCEKAAKNVDYFLVSLHSSSEGNWNSIANNPSAWQNTTKAFENLERLHAETHLNFTVLKQNYREIPGFVEFVSNRKNVKRINFICFNPWLSRSSAQAKEDNKKMMASYDEIMPMVEQGCRNAMEKEIDVAVRYFPFCKLPEFLRSNNFNYITDIFDRNEWDRELWFKDEFKKNIAMLYEIAERVGLEGELSQRLQHAFCRYYKGFRRFFKQLKECESCSHNLICDMPHNEQVEFFPNMKFRGFEGEQIKDAGYYFRKNDA